MADKIARVAAAMGAPTAWKALESDLATAMQTAAARQTWAVAEGPVRDVALREASWEALREPPGLCV